MEGTCESSLLQALTIEQNPSLDFHETQTPSSNDEEDENEKDEPTEVERMASFLASHGVLQEYLSESARADARAE